MPIKRDNHGLTNKQARFISEYVKDWSIGQTAKRLGIKVAAANAYLQRPPVIKRLEELRAEMDRAAIADAQEVAEYLTRVMRGEETEDNLKGVGAGMQVEIKQQVKPKDRLKAAELLGKHYSMFTDKVEVKGDLPVIIVDDIEIVDDLGTSKNG